MLDLFTPNSKVQKDRSLIRETDFRMAKYSRRGLLLSITVFTVTLILGDFFKQSINLAIGLAAALLLITLLRGYLMFGFDAIYPRAPAKWRTMFFLSSMLGATWWGIIVACITYVLGFKGETLFLWLYTVVFYSGMCAVLAPYLRFLTLYLFLGLAPIIVISFVLNTADGYLYGLIMALLYLMLRNQAMLLCESYWERLEANYILKQRADTLELEKRDSQAAAQLNHEFLVQLSDEFRSTLNDIVGALSVLSHDSNITDKQRQLLSIAEKAGERQLQMVNSVIDYSKIKAHKLLLDETVFNLPKLIEESFDEKEVDAEIHGKEFSLNFAEHIPTRVKGDSIRTSQLINSLIDQSISLGQGTDLIVNIHCEQDGSAQLSLSIDIIDEGESNAAALIGMGMSQSTPKVSGFNLNMSKHLAVAMGGDIGITDSEKLTFWLELPLTPLSSQSFLKQYESKFHGEHVLVIDAPRKIEQELLEIFTGWGLKPLFATASQDLTEIMQEHFDKGRDLDLVLIFSRKDSLTAIPQSQKIVQLEAVNDVPQVLVVSHLQAGSRILARYIEEKNAIQVIQKPITQDKLYQAFSNIWLQPQAEQARKLSKILLIEDNSVDQLVISNMLEKMNFSLDVTASAESGLKRLEQRDYDLVFLSCHLNGCEDCRDSFALAQQIRELNEREQKRVPLLGLTMVKNDQLDRLCLTSGIDDTIAKPIRRDELKKQLDHWLVTHA
ncbi:response regulator [Halioxenophilus sp. WMMB6]|uniref:response regulator n=1 Tax=Halioxenophilus sp. WMMB6 TaxID=3073815 RepID=UPI00295E82C6|nr:response regulator [Halioxenophilus sp. WMMB6]